MSRCPLFAYLIGLALLSNVERLSGGGYGEEKHEIGTLAGDVLNWKNLIQNYIVQVRIVQTINMD